MKKVICMIALAAIAVGTLMPAASQAQTMSKDSMRMQKKMMKKDMKMKKKMKRDTTKM